MGLRRDLLNLKGHMNHAITLGSFSGGRVWVEDENGSFPAEVKLRTKTRSLMGMWHDIHDKPITFDARRFHQVEQREGHMWALAAYVPQAFRWISDENVERFLSLNFPCQNAKTKLEAKRLQISSRTENEKQADCGCAAGCCAEEAWQREASRKQEQAQGAAHRRRRPERAAAPVPAPVAAAEEPEAEEPPPTPATMRAMRQLSQADRFEELLTRNTMELL